MINSKGALESVKFMQAFWKDACDEGGLAWDDTNNNRAFHAGEISATLNGASIYIVAKRQKDKIKDDKGEPLWQDIEHAAPLPAGPAGQAALYVPFQHAVMKYSQEPEAGQGLPDAGCTKTENYGKWFEVNEGYTRRRHQDVGGAPDVVARSTSRCRSSAGPRARRAMLGYQGPATAKATEAYTKYIIVDMYAKAVQGTKAEDAVKWAEGELKKIYEG